MNKIEAFVDIRPVTRCIHCKIQTAGMCPRCRAYSCIRQACIDAHNAKCKEIEEKKVAHEAASKEFELKPPGPDDDVIKIVTPIPTPPRKQSSRPARKIKRKKR